MNRPNNRLKQRIQINRIFLQFPVHLFLLSLILLFPFYQFHLSFLPFPVKILSGKPAFLPICRRPGRLTWLYSSATIFPTT